ncbi:phosphatidate cytidylyltransferase [Mucilaginibacter sp. AW1-3]
MKTRAITGLFFIIIMLASLLTGVWTFTAFFAILSLLCLNEFYKMVKTANVNPNIIAGLIGGVLIFVGIGLHYVLVIDSKFLLIIVPVIGSIFIAELYKHSENPFTNIAFTIVGLAYAIAPFCFFFALAFLKGSYSYHFPLAFMLLLWSNDTGAYVVGRWFGRTKLFERHSPQKTWEGFFGGVLFAVFVSGLIAYYFTEITKWEWAGMAALIGIFGTMGDLVESMLKRSLNTKDSGSLLPGHGGLLDRFDGLFLSAPLVFAYLYLITN